MSDLEGPAVSVGSKVYPLEFDEPSAIASRKHSAAPRADSLVWLSPAEVCEVIPGMTVTLLQRMRDAGKGPRYAKPSPKTVVYNLADVHAYVRSTIVTTKEQA